MRPVVFVPESKRLNVLLKEFRAATIIWPWWWTNTAASAAW